MNHRWSTRWGYGALLMLTTTLGCYRGVRDGIFDGDGTDGSHEGGICPEQPCDAGSECIAGRCQPPADQAPRCATNGFGDDSCGPDQVCALVGDQGRCVFSAPCDGHGDCDPGERGAMCNLDEAVTRKDQVCLVDACTEDAHCPNSSVCAVREGGVGRCGDGQFGSPCTSAGHCISGSCFAPVGEQLGVCS